VGGIVGIRTQVPAILIELPGGARVNIAATAPSALVNIAATAPSALVAATLKALRA